MNDQTVIVPKTCDHCGAKVLVSCVFGGRSVSQSWYAIVCRACGRTNHWQLPGTCLDSWIDPGAESAS